MRLLFVIHRFGRDIIGGAERLAWMYACVLAERGHEVSVATTCARDYMTWRDEYAEGSAECVEGFTIHRIPVAQPRDVAAFKRLSNRLARRPDDRPLALEWMRAQGPDSPAMTAWIAANARDFDAAFLFNYLYYNTWQALPHLADRAILVPFAHDEWTLGIGAYRALFSGAAVVGTSSDTEERLLRARFGAYLPPDVVRLGAGVEITPSHGMNSIGGADATSPDEHDKVLAELRTPFDDKPFVLLLGRQSAAKGTPDAVRLFAETARLGAPAALPVLLVAGPPESGFRLPPPARHHRLLPETLSENTARQARASALASLHVSPHESLNLEALAALAAGTPLLVARQSAATMELLDRGAPGVAFEARGPGAAADLRRALAEIAALDRAATRSAAHAYLRTHHDWCAVADRLEMAVELAARHAQGLGV